MYDLKRAKNDFPWTRVVRNAVEPWREIGSGWFDRSIPEGWSDVIHKALLDIDAALEAAGARESICIVQAKEKFGRLRVYVSFRGAVDPDTCAMVRNILRRAECETGRVCCFCGTQHGVLQREGWIHYSCDPCEREFMRRRSGLDVD